MSPLKRLDTQRFEFGDELTRGEVEQLASDLAVKVVQSEVWRRVKPSTWDLLNEILLARRPDVELRLYGGVYDSLCDLSFVHRVRNVRRFSADCLMRVEGIEHLGFLQNLEELSIGIYGLESFDFLDLLTPRIRCLSLGATKSKKPRLDALSRFHSLRELHLEGQQGAIEVLSRLPELEKVTLRSISTANLDYICELPRLWWLDIKLGGIRDFSAIESKRSIKYLELWQIRGLSDLGFISSLTGLQFLFLQSLRNVRDIPDLSKLTRLRRLHLENLKGLRDVSAIAKARALEEFSHVSAQNIAPEQYEPLMRMPTLRSVRVGFGSQKKNEAFAALTTQNGKNLDAGGKLGKQFVFV
jgi:hypothetical protein